MIRPFCTAECAFCNWRYEGTAQEASKQLHAHLKDKHPWWIITKEPKLGDKVIGWVKGNE